MEKDTQIMIEQIGQKLDTIIALLLRSLPKNIDGLPLKEQIKILNNLGLRPLEISKIIGRSANYVSKELTLIRKEK